MGDMNKHRENKRSSYHLSKALHMARFATNSSGRPQLTCPKKQVYLYNWSLIRVGGDHPENDTVGNGKLVALEGYTTSDLLDHDKFRTAPIETRIEKLKLKTVDGMNILLMGMIDEQHSYENGFPLLVIHLFLFGFPYNWNNVLNRCFGQPKLNASVLPASKEKESVWQAKDETQNSGCIETYMENMGTGKSSLLEAEEKIITVEEMLSKLTPGESLARGSKRGRNGSQPIRSSKRLKCGNSSINSEQKVVTPFVGLVENSNHTTSVKPKRKDMTKDETQNSGCIETYMKNMGTGNSSLLEAEEKIIEVEEKLSKVTSGESLARGSKSGRNGLQPIRSSKRLKCGNLSIYSEPKVFTPLMGLVENSNHTTSVKPKRKDMTKDQMYLCTGDYKNFERDDHLAKSDSKVLRKKSLNFSVSPEDKGSVKCKENIVNDVLRSMKETRELEKQIKSETEQSPLVSVHLQHLENNCTSGGEQTQKTQMPVSEFRYPIPLDTPVTKRNRMNKSSQASRGQLCVRFEITDEAVKKASDVEHEIHSDNIICTKRSSKTCEKNILSPSDSESTAIPSETCLSYSAENKPFSLPENHLNSNVTKCVKHVNELGTERKRRPRTRTRCTDQPPQLSDSFSCHQTNVNDNVTLKCNDIKATCSTTSYKGPSTIEHCTASENCTEIGENCTKTNGNGQGSIQTPKTRIEINMQTKTKKRQSLNNIPLTPPHRVHRTPEEVSKAFGLKTSRSGRLLVPPLAHWCNQTIAYDMDGGIIAILDASSQRDKHYGNSIFMPPEQKDAILIRKKLCNAANESNLTLRSSKKAGKD
ncbi:kinetochore-associated protein KNL-2 homolog [Cryptomeria japonica]|uniref:kinetochore-associated protein KNL-2 homolog n=1 Tax=Cryptomeria japonica TaxID=3369 RepID=UPI0027DA6B4F|nr:kinetochore-associated protein KNL-2 homolog [Cryptomeria japonica]